MSTTAELTKKARFLRNAAPREYEQFFAEFAAYTDRAFEIMLNTIENVQLVQGHAQQCVKIRNALEEAKNNG